jgi:hypothetical protein
VILLAQAAALVLVVVSVSASRFYPMNYPIPIVENGILQNLCKLLSVYQ